MHLRAVGDLTYVNGVGALTLARSGRSTGPGEPQLCGHLTDKETLVRDAVAWQAARLLEREQQMLLRLNSLSGLERLRDALVQDDVLYSCAPGSGTGARAASDQEAPEVLARYFESWEHLLAAGLRRMRERGVLRQDADPERLATGIVAALQGGYLLARTAQNTEPMAIALDMALDNVRRFATE